ncbi:dicarboxylate/amino acid:cation symporter [Corynebacterium mastitidis]|uniref:Dicarboxylate/amino acid:cation symporter n=1 Tax=Corynebacterium mastitidis TaxID=161890 RepID=A0ABU8NW22_9CORY
MDIKRMASSLLARVIAAIILGIACSFFLPEALARIFITFNGLFSQFLGFFVPVLIFALITPAIAGLGWGAGKWLAITTAVAYASTILSGLLAYGVARAVYPSLLAGERLDTGVSDIEAGALAPYFTVEMPPPMELMSALLLAFCLGVAMATMKADRLYNATRELEQIVMKVVGSFIVPLLPLFIFGMFLNLGMNGNLVDTLVAFGKVLVLATAMTLVYLLLQFLLAGALTGTNPLRALRTMLPAYGTALGTASSAATIPVTYRAVRSNGVASSVAGFVVPLCAMIHLAGSMMKLTLFAFAIVYMAGMDVSVGLAVGFIFMLGITMIAAPGVPGGGVMAAVALLSSMLGFGEDQVALMIAAYIAIDSFGTAANVTGDGAIALIINKFARGDLPEREPGGEDLEAGLTEAADPAGRA